VIFNNTEYGLRKAGGEDGNTDSRGEGWREAISVEGKKGEWRENRKVAPSQSDSCSCYLKNSVEIPQSVQGSLTSIDQRL